MVIADCRTRNDQRNQMDGGLMATSGKLVHYYELHDCKLQVRGQKGSGGTSEGTQALWQVPVHRLHAEDAVVRVVVVVVVRTP